MTFPEAQQFIEANMITMPADYERKLALAVAQQIEEGSSLPFSAIIERCVKDLVGEASLSGF